MKDTYENIKRIIATLKPANAALNINDFIAILNASHQGYLDPITDRDILYKGLYGNLFGTNIWVSRNIEIGTIYICNENVETFSHGKWSLPINLDWDTNSIRRMWKLKAFW